MSRILVKVKEKYLKDFLITSSGAIINKKEFVEVNDMDGFVKTYILQDNVEIKDVVDEKGIENDNKSEDWNFRQK